MEGAGSRLGRASSRYGQPPPSSSPSTFTGPVRRWEKKWVHVSSPPRSRSSITRQQKSNASRSNDHRKSVGPPGVLLCKWTPLTEPPITADELEERPLTPPRRKFRYTPIAVLEEKKREAVKMVPTRAKSGKEEEARQEQMSDDESIDGLLNINQGLIEDEPQEDNECFSTPQCFKTQLNLELPLKAREDSPDPGWSSQLKP